MRNDFAVSLSLDVSYSTSKKECGDNRGASDHTRSFTRSTHQIILPGKWSPKSTKTYRKGNVKKPRLRKECGNVEGMASTPFPFLFRTVIYEVDNTNP